MTEDKEIKEIQYEKIMKALDIASLWIDVKPFKKIVNIKFNK